MVFKKRKVCIDMKRIVIITEQPLSEITGEEKDEETMEPGFFFGSFFVPFSEVMRV